MVVRPKQCVIGTFVQALHDDHNGGLLWVVQAGGADLPPPGPRHRAFGIALGAVRVVGVVDQNDISPNAEKRATGRSREAGASGRRVELRLGVLVEGDLEALAPPALVPRRQQ